MAGLTNRVKIEGAYIGKLIKTNEENHCGGRKQITFRYKHI